ncbi:hypothetical protein [Acidisphaera sp. L21]|uniref:hypothetical protein n=1 Tax=Acidisphaera sp. L21 TaxID=1641851 RepID=UPI00131BE2C1|nr:hypothetical protein [Acidisphaera sp. L21]
MALAGTITLMTNHDNAGVGQGIASRDGAFTVLSAGMPATRLTLMTIQNSTNPVGARLVPSQPTVLLFAP